jgi:hypothetical protein
MDACTKDAMFRIDGIGHAYACQEHLGALVDEMVMESDFVVGVQVKYAARAGIRCSWGRRAGFEKVSDLTNT